MIPASERTRRRSWPLSMRTPAAGFLPDFCNVRMVFLVVLATELMALILALAQPIQSGLWAYLGQTSLFMQWITLLCTAVLCRLRNVLAKRPVWQAALVSYAIILLVTWLFSVLAYRVGMVPIVLPMQPTDFYLRNLAIAGIVGAVVLRYFYLQQQYRHRLYLEAEARNEALQARIQPHFLFNSMNIIASLTRSNPRLAEQVVENLSDLFRASLAKADKRVSLKEELELCQRYLDIEQLRLGARLNVDMRVDESLYDVQLPLLLIQPLVENAVYHGIQPRTEGGWVRIHVEDSGDQVRIVIRNPLPERQSTAGHGLALDNIRERLMYWFGEKAALSTGQQGEEFVAELRLPKEPTT